MPTNFLSLPSEIRNNIYERLLVLQEPIEFRYSKFERLQNLTPELLLVNKTIYREASSLMYAQNCFNISICTSEEVVSFIERIGRNNARYIQHIYIDFPAFEYLVLDAVMLYSESTDALAKIQSDCSNLGSITMSPHSIHAMERRLSTLDNAKITAEVIALVNSHFRAITTLREVIVDVYEDSSNDEMRRSMKSHGWKLNTIARTEDVSSDPSFSDGDFDGLYYDDNYDDSDYGHNEYDVDYDSDFWRRAGD
ncbi:hypothetical protein BKA66DRAFT_445259 [Pyrenochaeta sp. MPI-SDFR-AT-0127]|nr:hypothetical protein BKA66DRAFT_445259 [Pyrenochaeta sp. MPI-SDFR-AT-0127]